MSSTRRSPRSQPGRGSHQDKTSSSCCATALRILAVAALLTATVAAAVVLYGLTAFQIDYEKAVEESASHHGYASYIDLHLSCRQKSDARDDPVHSDEYRALLFAQCLSRQFQYIFVIAWAAGVELAAVVVGFVALFTRSRVVEKQRITMIACVLALAGAAVAMHLMGGARGGLRRLIRCDDYQTTDIAQIKLDGNFCITEHDKPDIDTAINLLLRFDVFFAGAGASVFAMALLLGALAASHTPCTGDSSKRERWQASSRQLLKDGARRRAAAVSRTSNGQRLHVDNGSADAKSRPQARDNSDGKLLLGDDLTTRTSD